MSVKNSNDEPATFRLVVQCLNQLRHRVPQYIVKIQKKKEKELKVDHILMQWQGIRYYKVRKEINIKRQQMSFWFQI
jgi:hypothetical protein